MLVLLFSQKSKVEADNQQPQLLQAENASCVQDDNNSDL